MDKKKFLFQSLIGCSALIFAVKILTSAAVKKKPAPKNALDGSTIEKIKTYTAGQLTRLKVPGAILAVVENDKIANISSYGKARPGGEAPGPQTPFFIGSLTKSFTALAVMQLVEAGKIDLDAPVQRYLPWFRVADPLASGRITVRHLLNQTSGLPESVGERLLANFDNSPKATERQVRALAKVKTTLPPGSKCEYSNLNYNVLGLVIEAASGKSYPSYIQNHIFDPLGMSHSYTSKEAAKRNGLAMGYRHWLSIPFPAPNLPVPGGSLPSGQLISCAEDMAHYLIAHLNEGRFGKIQILSKEGIEELHRGETEYVKWGISGGKYGMGWFEINVGQTKTFSHGGNVPDFASFAVLIPEQKGGLVLLLNANPYGMPPIIGEVGAGITALLAGQQPDPIHLNFIQWIMRFLLLIPLLQTIGGIVTLRRLSNWCQNPQSRPSRGRLWGQHILLPLVPNLTLAGILSAIVGNKLFGFLRLFIPDFSWITLICGSFAGIWSCVRTGLMIRTLQSNEGPSND